MKGVKCSIFADIPMELKINQSLVFSKKLAEKSREIEGSQSNM